MSHFKMKALFRALAGLLHKAGLQARLNIYSQFTYDNDLKLKAAALVGSSADGTIILDVGNGLFEGYMVLDVSAIEVASNDEVYRVVLEGSPDAAFGTAANIAPVAEITLGSAVGAAPLGTADVAGRYCVPFRNERNGTTYRYLRIRTVVGGTIASGINYFAWIAKD